MRTFVLLLAVLGAVRALQAPVEYEYKYEARVGSGIQAARPQFAGTGLRATVKVTVRDANDVDFEVSEVEVGERSQALAEDGHAPLDIPYKAAKDKTLEQTFTAHPLKKDGDTVLDVPADDLLWVTNVRRGIVNFFRIAPLIDPSSVRPSQSGDYADPQSFSRDEDTYAGRCQVGYSVSKASPHDIPDEPTEDIQSMKARKGPGGRQIQLEDDYYRVQLSLDHSTCKDRVALLQTGATNLTNATDSSFRDVAVRSMIGQYVLKGSPGKFRMESGLVEAEFLIDPFGVNSDKMITISNQTMDLIAARPVPGGLKQNPQPTKAIKTWAQQVQSPNQQPQGYAPKWIEYVKDQSDSSYSPVFYERLSSGFGIPDEFKQTVQKRVQDALQRAAKQLQVQNKDRTDKPEQYKGSEDGRAAQSLHEAHKLIRTMRKEDMEKLDKQLKQQAQQCQLCYDLFIETLAVAGSGASLDLLLDKVQSDELSDNRTASLFFSLANNVQSPEAIDKIMQFALSLDEDQKALVSLLVKPNVAIMIRRLCISEQEQRFSHMMPMFGDKQCDRQSVINKYLPNLEQKIKSSSKMWVKILNVLAVADLGARESLDILAQVAQGKITDDLFVRYAAIHGMSAATFDNCTQDQIFNIVQPIAESQTEDFRVRQIAYDTLLSWRPNVTFIQRMATSAWKEPSVQIQSYLYNAIDSLAVNDDAEFKPQSSAARNLRSFTRQMIPSVHRAFTYKDSRYLDKEQVGAEGEISWLTGLRSYFPREIYGYLVAQLGRLRIPLIETVTFGNIQSANAYTRDILSAMRGNPRHLASHRRARDASSDEPDLYHYTKIFDSSELFLPLTDELYAKVQETGQNLLRGSNSTGDEDQSLIYKYFNPVEINLILPTPTGLFTHTEVSSPTIVFMNLKTQASVSSKSGSSDSSKLPQLGNIDVSAEGIVKAITKANTYTYVFAPWSNNTAVAAVDNEKSISVPMKLRLAYDVQMPAQQLWAQITPMFNQSSDSIPVVKVRNVPFTAIGKRPLPSAANSEDFDDVDRARWTYDDSQMLQRTLPISADATGLNAEVKYVGEMELPINQPNIMRMMLEPSRLASLLASPSIKNYDLSLYRKPGDAQNKNIGLALRHIMKKGSGSAQIQVPDDAHKPIDISPDDSLDQRQQKLAQFSSENNHEFSAHANFTGGDDKLYEAAIFAAEQERTENSEKVKRVFYKIQATLLEKNSKSDRKPKTCILMAVDRPQLIPSKKDDHKSNSSPNPPFVQSKIAMDVFEGTNLKPDSSIAKSTADLTVSDNRMKAIMELDPNGDFYFSNSSELYRLAVYDQMHLRLDWQTPSPQVKNATLRLQDLMEGYMFPKIVKNRLDGNKPNQMDVMADRSIADDRADVFVRLPKQTVHAERVQIQPWFDYLTGFTGNIFGVYSSSSQKTFRSSGDGRCHIEKDRVQTSDGVKVEVHPTACEVIAADVQKGDEHLQVIHAQYPQASSEDKFVRVTSAKDNAEVIIQGRSVRVNGKILEDSDNEEDIKDSSGKVVGKVSRDNDKIDIDITNKIRATLESDHSLIVTLDKNHFKAAAEGVCGNFNDSPDDDLRGPKKCPYDPKSQGEMFGAAWIKQDELQCKEPDMQPILEEVRDYQSHCPHDVGQQQCGGLQAYAIEDIDGQSCVTTDKEPVCQPGCQSSGTFVVPDVTFKCWSEGNVPLEVTEGKGQGYVLEEPAEKEDTMKTQNYNAPRDCTPASLSAHASSDNDCFERGYPVSQEGPMVCISSDPADVCKPECRVIDTQPRDLQGKCWNFPDAPQQVRDALRKGYASSPASQSAEFERRMAVHSARLCSKPDQ
ncbi:Lipid transport protein N-terminal [Trinorchestia longiramus]|nr:Lipid transport protein N-terminal [Trinorchestia longiramus]